VDIVSFFKNKQAKVFVKFINVIVRTNFQEKGAEAFEKKAENCVEDVLFLWESFSELVIL
jgi:hypothetical protein